MEGLFDWEDVGEKIPYDDGWNLYWFIKKNLDDPDGEHEAAPCYIIPPILRLYSHKNGEEEDMLTKGCGEDSFNYQNARMYGAVELDFGVSDELENYISLCRGILADEDPYVWKNMSGEDLNCYGDGQEYWRDKVDDLFDSLQKKKVIKYLDSRKGTFIFRVRNPEDVYAYDILGYISRYFTVYISFREADILNNEYLPPTYWSDVNNWVKHCGEQYSSKNKEILNLYESYLNIFE